MSRERKNREIHELHGIIRKLTKQNNMLKRDLARALKHQATLPDQNDLYDQEDEQQLVVIPKEDTCPACQGDVTKIYLDKQGTLILCKSCDYRKRTID
jgi:hypothetical protein